MGFFPGSRRQFILISTPNSSKFMVSWRASERAIPMEWKFLNILKTFSIQFFARSIGLAVKKNLHLLHEKSRKLRGLDEYKGPHDLPFPVNL